MPLDLFLNHNRLFPLTKGLKNRGVLLLINLLFAFLVSSERMPEDIVSVDFEIFGVVQGVFFRKNTQDQANALGVKGWCKNTPHGTVQGQVQGPPEKIKLMKDWLQHTGSPLSRIEKAEFKNEHKIEEYTFQDFDVVRRKR